MSAPDNGGPAYPIVGSGLDDTVRWEGMSLRDWMAGVTLSAMAQGLRLNWTPEQYAKCAYQIADAMIAERNRGHPPPARKEPDEEIPF